MATLIRGDGRTVTAFQDAIGFDFAFQGRTGIIANVGQQCKIEATGSQATISSGMAVLQGRQIVFDGTDKISLPVYQGTTINSLIYAELDMAGLAPSGKDGKVTIKRIDATGSQYPTLPPSDNLGINPKGKANVSLGIVTIQSGAPYAGKPDFYLSPKSTSSYEGGNIKGTSGKLQIQVSPLAQVTGIILGLKIASINENKEVQVPIFSTGAYNKFGSTTFITKRTDLEEIDLIEINVDFGANLIEITIEKNGQPIQEEIRASYRLIY